MATHSSETLGSGPAVAALLSVGIGLLALALSHVGSEVSGSFKNTMQALGNLWIPGAKGIGPYSGKETAALLTWLGGWLLLHLLLRKRELSIMLSAIVSLLLIGTATTLLWPPVTEIVVHHLQRAP